MRIQVFFLLTAITVFGVTLACTSEVRSVSHANTVAATDSIGWESMDHDQRVKYMRTTVLPEMRQLFSAFDPVRFDRINCKTCHGDGATNETFKMPNPKLPKLPATSEGFRELMKKDSAIMVFMQQTVKPRMAALLGKTPFDPNTNPKGFGCGNCHTTQAK